MCAEMAHSFWVKLLKGTLRMHLTRCYIYIYVCVRECVCLNILEATWAAGLRLGPSGVH